MEFGLIGHKLAHSFSKAYFTQKFREENIPATYHNFELEDFHSLPKLMERHPDLRGLNVTIPYKVAVIPLLDELDPDAADVGAVNVIRIINIPGKGKKLKGYNTDVGGFRDSLAEFYTASPGGCALILGTGGASLAVRRVLEHYFSFDCVENASRSQHGKGIYSYDQLKHSGLHRWKLIVNTTPVGQHPFEGQMPDLPYDTLTPAHFLFDLVYNPERTLFLEEGLLRECKVKGGMEMLIRQAELSWEIWNR